MDRFERFNQLVADFEGFSEWHDFCQLRTVESWFGLVDVLRAEEMIDREDMPSGCTKGCIIDWRNDYVYRIGFQDVIEWGNTHDYKDYCEREYDLYQQMNADTEIPQDVFELFLPVDFVGNYKITIDGMEYTMAVYGQERVDIDEERVFTTSLERYSEDWTFPHSEEEVTEEWENFEETEQVIMCFPNDINRVMAEYNINDIHASNVGFLNGELRIFDYAGYGIL